PVDAAAANRRAGECPTDRVLFLHHAHALRAALEDAVASDQAFALVQEFRKFFKKFVAERNESIWKVPTRAADDEVALVQPRAGRAFVKIQNPLALYEGVEEGGHRAYVHRVRAEPDQVRRKTVQFGK